MKHAMYPTVFNPLAIGPITVRNRIFVPAHTTSYGDNNLPTDRHLAYHKARAAGGAGLIIFEAIRVHRSSLGRKQGVNGYERACIPRFRRISDAVRSEGCKLFGQIIHLGRHIDGNYTRTPAWGASPIPWTATAPAPHPMTTSEIRQVVDAHAATAVNLVEAGLDGIEVQMAHGHLLQQFMSPASNHRNDEYGGALENRLRFARETLAAVRAAIGKEVALGIRISADEFMPDGLSIDDMCEIIPLLIQETAVDFVNVSHSAYHGSYTIATQMADMSFPVGTFLPLTTRINRALFALSVKPVVMTVCGYRSVEDAESVLVAGHADMVGMARAHIADPAIVNKAKNGREESTIPCIGCNQGCAGMLEKSLAITCLSNPRAGLEQQWSPLEEEPDKTDHRVLVVGGGPGGCEAAVTAAAMGHSVTLWEQVDRLGGELNWTQAMPLRAEFQSLLQSLRHRLIEHKVDVHLNRLATSEAIQEFAPDSLILATGAIAEHESFDGGGSGLTLQQALHNVEALGQDVVLQDVTGSWAVASTVECLADLGKSVTVVVPGGAPAWMINIYSLYALRRRWVEKHIRIIANHRIQSYDGQAVQLTDLSVGKNGVTLTATAVIASGHGTSNSAINDELAALQLNGQLSMNIVAIGDCQAPRTALEAIFEGHEAARNVNRKVAVERI